MQDHRNHPTRTLPRPAGPRPAGSPPADPGLRVGDAERGRVVDQLADHHAAGRLTLAEFEERMGAAWTARTGADLEVLTRDLPAPSRPPAPARGRDRPATDPRVRTYLAVMALLWLIWLVSGAGYPWPVWPMVGWGVGLLGHRGGHPAGRRR